MFGTLTHIKMYKAKANDLEYQITYNSNTKRIKQIHSSAEISSIHDEYNQKEDNVRNQIKELPDKSGNEYLELMAELQEFQDMEEESVKEAEEMSKQYEEHIDVENASLETQLQAIRADLEGLEEARKQDIEDDFSYFQN